jgi:hypothetical protein
MSLRLGLGSGDRPWAKEIMAASIRASSWAVAISVGQASTTTTGFSNNDDFSSIKHVKLSMINPFIY